LVFVLVGNSYFLLRQNRCTRIETLGNTEKERQKERQRERKREKERKKEKDRERKRDGETEREKERQREANIKPTVNLRCVQVFGVGVS
jgi:hypothetical protein